MKALGGQVGMAASTDEGAVARWVKNEIKAIMPEFGMVIEIR
jgi:hypothetical protein